MSQRTYTISKGQQYDRGGAYVEHGPLAASYAADGSFSHGQGVRVADADAVAEAVRRVIATGEPETLVLGEADTLIGPSPEQQAIQRQLLACRLWNASEGCALHGELCHEAQS